MSAISETKNIDQGFPRINMILQALVDTFAHPVWIADENGAVCMNSLAKSMMQQGASIDQTGQRIKPGESKKVTVLGKRYQLNKRDINHGTNCALLELHADENAELKLRESTKKLKQALSRQ